MSSSPASDLDSTLKSYTHKDSTGTPINLSSELFYQTSSNFFVKCPTQRGRRKGTTSGVALKYVVILRDREKASEAGLHPKAEEVIAGDHGGIVRFINHICDSSWRAKFVQAKITMRTSINLVESIGQT